MQLAAGSPFWAFSLRRLPTLCALRLREPDPPRMTSDALCRGSGPAAGSPSRVGVSGGPTYVGLAERATFARAAVHRACLRPGNKDDPERLPSVRPMTSRPRWAPSGSVFNRAFEVPGTLSRAPESLAAVRRTRAPGSRYPAELEGRHRWSLSRSPLQAPARRGKDASHRLLQPNHFNRAPVRIAWCPRCSIRLRDRHARRGITP